MNPSERSTLIESFGNAHAVLVASLQAFPLEMWRFKPSPDRWSVHEMIVHIADSEANSYVRCRRLVAEPGSTVMAYDENRWATALDYHSQSTEEALELFKWLRARTYTLVKSLPDSVWSNTVYHTEYGTMTMDDWLRLYERHIPEHVAQMHANHEAWLLTQ